MTEVYETISEKKMFRRVSVLIDGKTLEALNTLMKKKHLRISDVIRLSIMHYFQHEIGGKSDLGELEKIVQQLADGSHLVTDLETLISLLKELKLTGNSERLQEIAERDGFKEGLYYKSIGINDFVEILKQMELKNWLKLRTESNNCCLLILPAPELQEYLSHFIKGISRAFDMRVKIEKIGERNIVLRIE